MEVILFNLFKRGSLRDPSIISFFANKFLFSSKSTCYNILMQVTIHCHPKLMAKISIYNQLNLRRRRDFFFPIDNYMFKIGQAGLLFCLCPVFSTTILQKNIDFSRIRTRIVRVEGECADHLTTTTDLLSQTLSSRTSFERISFR